MSSQAGIKDEKLMSGLVVPLKELIESRSMTNNSGLGQLPSHRAKLLGSGHV